MSINTKVDIENLWWEVNIDYLELQIKHYIVILAIVCSKRKQYYDDIDLLTGRQLFFD